MNKDNAKDYLPLVQAVADGKTIQSHVDGGRWMDHNGEVNFTLPPCRYRIKPEPREVWVNIYSDGQLGRAYATKEQANAVKLSHPCKKVKCAKFVEVMED